MSEKMGLFEKHFREVLREDIEKRYQQYMEDQNDWWKQWEAVQEEAQLRECRDTFRRDKTGRPVKVPCGASYREGKNGRGKAIKPGDTAREDETGEMHSVPPCKRLKAGANKKAVPVCPGEPTREKNGQIELIRKPKKRP